MKLLELRRGYAIEDAHSFPMGAVMYDRMCTDNAIALWQFAAVEARKPFGFVDECPIVTHTRLPALGIVTLTVRGFYEVDDGTSQTSA